RVRQVGIETAEAFRERRSFDLPGGRLLAHRAEQSTDRRPEGERSPEGAPDRRAQLRVRDRLVRAARLLAEIVAARVAVFRAPRPVRRSGHAAGLVAIVALRGAD